MTETAGPTDYRPDRDIAPGTTEATIDGENEGQSTKSAAIRLTRRWDDVVQLVSIKMSGI